MNRIFTLIFRFCKPIFFSCFSHVVDQVRLNLHNGVSFPVHVFGRNMLTVNDLLNAHSRIDAAYPIIPPPLRCKLCISYSPLINTPHLIDTHPRIAPKTKETLYRVKSRDLFSFLLACELHLANCILFRLLNCGAFARIARAVP